MKTGVYKIEIRSDLYVGGTVLFKMRKAGHLYRLRRNIHKNPVLQQLFNLHGESQFRITPLEPCDKDQLRSREQHWIDRLKPSINLAKYTDDSPMKDRHHTPESIEKIRRKNSDTCFQYSLTGKFIKKWASRSKASRELGINQADICSCIQGRLLSAGRYIWRNEYAPKIETYSNNQSRPIVEIRNGRIVREWLSMNDCARDTGLSSAGVRKYVTNQVVKKKINLQYK